MRFRLAFFCLALVSVAPAATRLVGPGKTYSRPCQAFAAAADGDTVEIDAAGSYAGDVCSIYRNNLTIRGTGGRAWIDAAGKNAEGKAIWVIKGSNTVVENIEFSGATVPDRNGAGIRQEGLNLTLRRCYFHDNEEGILTNDSNSVILIEYSEFARNGYGDGYSHNIYIGHVSKFTLRYSYSHHARIGHLVKTRAAENYILYNRIADEADGTSSFAVDFSNGGKSYLIGNLIQQGPRAENWNVISYMTGGADSRNPSHQFYAVNNTFVNEVQPDNTYFILAGSGASPMILMNNIFAGSAMPVTNQANAVLTANLTGIDPKLVDMAHYDYHLQPGSPAIDAGTTPDSSLGDGFSLTPQSQYAHPSCSQDRPVNGKIDIGAYEYAAGAQPPVNCGGAVPSGLRFVPLPPCRVVDTRLASGSLGGPVIAGGTSRTFPLPSGACGIASTAQAYSLNVTAVPQGQLGYLTVWPAGQQMPLVSTLNSFDGRYKANAAIVPAGQSGAISVYATHATHVVLDINGYFVSAADPAALAFYPVTPCRVFDTRVSGPVLGANTSRTFGVRGGACGVPATAQAYSLNFTVVPQGPLSYLTVWPAASAMPLVSTLNAPTGAVTANAAIVPAGQNGSIDVYATSATDVLADINGYFAAAGTGGLSFNTITPCRVADTRLAAGPLGGPTLSGVRDLPAANACGLPASAKAYSFNITAVPPGFLAYLTAWPAGQTMPLASTLNSFDGTVVSNAAIVPALNGSISVYVSDRSEVVIDANGYFAP